MLIPCILYINDEPNYFRDISLMYVYLNNKYRNFKLTKPHEITAVIRQNEITDIIYYETI